VSVEHVGDLVVARARYGSLSVFWHWMSGSQSPCWVEHSIRLVIAKAGLPSSLVSGWDLQQQVSGTSEPSGTIGDSGLGLLPQAASTSVRASASFMRWS